MGRCKEGGLHCVLICVVAHGCIAGPLNEGALIFHHLQFYTAQAPYSRLPGWSRESREVTLAHGMSKVDCVFFTHF
jgi:hypothetical protein